MPSGGHRRARRRSSLARATTSRASRGPPSGSRALITRSPTADMVVGGRVSGWSVECQRVVVFYCHEVDPLSWRSQMFSANTYRIRIATTSDADTIESWGSGPLTGRVLVGEIAGAPAAAMSLMDGQTASDPAQNTDHLLANMRVRAVSMVAHAAAPSLRIGRWLVCRSGIAGRERRVGEDRGRARAGRRVAAVEPKDRLRQRARGALPGPSCCLER